jgi:hypothetical protein
VKTIVAAFSPELPHDLQQGLLHRKDLRVQAVRTLPDLLERLARGADICLVGSQLGGENAASISQAVRSTRRAAAPPLILILTSGATAPAGASQLFDEVVEWPQQAPTLYTALARFLGFAAREHERYPVRAHVFLGGTGDNYLGTTIDLSPDGMLLRTTRALPFGDRMPLRISVPGRPGEIALSGRVVRCDNQTYAPDHACAMRFEGVSEESRHALRDYFTQLSGGRSFRWKMVRSGEKTLIYLSGLLNAEVDLAPLKQLRGEVHFHMREFRRISSDSIQTWIDLMRSLTGVSKIRLYECPIQFVQQANAISNLLEHTEVVSFFAPYLCSRCGLDEERLIDVRRDMYDAAGVLQRRAPGFSCAGCNGPLSFDDIPERFFMFL